MKKILFAIITITTLNAEMFNLHNLLKTEETKEVKELKKAEKTSFEKYNKTMSKITEQKKSEFSLKKAKVIDIFVREDYSVLANSYVVKQPEHWIKILVKEKELWY